MEARDVGGQQAFEEDGRLAQGELRPKAGPGADAEGQIGAGPGGTAAGVGEPARVELLRIRPQSGVAMREIRADQQVRPRLDGVAGQGVALGGVPGQDPGGRVEPERLADQCLDGLAALRRACVAGRECLLADLGVSVEEQVQPGQRGGGGLVAGDQQGDQLVAQQLGGVRGALGRGVDQYVQHPWPVGAGGSGPGGGHGVPGDRVDPGQVGGDGVPGVDGAGGQRRQRGHHGGDGGQFVCGGVVERMPGERTPDGVQGEAAHFLADVEGLPGPCVAGPPLGRGPGRIGDPLLVAAHPRSGELRLQHPPLPLPRLTGRGDDTVADEQAGAVRALDVPVRVPGEHMLDRRGLGDQDRGPRPETEGGHASELLAHLGQQVDQFTSVGAPPFHEGGVQFGDRPARAGLLRGGRPSRGVGGHASSPVRP